MSVSAPEWAMKVARDIGSRWWCHACNCREGLECEPTKDVARALAAERESGAAQLTEIAQAMWDRCETKRPDDPFKVGEGEMEDATTAWCFDKAAEAIRSRV